MNVSTSVSQTEAIKGLIAYYESQQPLDLNPSDTLKNDTFLINASDTVPEERNP